MAAENIFEEIADWHDAHAARLRLSLEGPGGDALAAETGLLREIKDARRRALMARAAALEVELAGEEVRAVKRELADWKRAAMVSRDLSTADRADTDREPVPDPASGASSDAAEARWTVRRVPTHMRELANLKAAERDMPVGDWLNEAILAYARGR